MLFMMGEAIHKVSHTWRDGPCSGCELNPGHVIVRRMCPRLNLVALSPLSTTPILNNVRRPGYPCETSARVIGTCRYR